MVQVHSVQPEKIGYMAEIDIFDESMHYLGKMDKTQAHQEGHWHKSVHLWIMNGKNVLLQLRAP